MDKKEEEVKKRDKWVNVDRKEKKKRTEKKIWIKVWEVEIRGANRRERVRKLKNIWRNDKGELWGRKYGRKRKWKKGKVGEREKSKNREREEGEE